MRFQLLSLSALVSTALSVALPPQPEGNITLATRDYDRPEFCKAIPDVAHKCAIGLSWNKNAIGQPGKGYIINHKCDVIGENENLKLILTSDTDNYPGAKPGWINGPNGVNVRINDFAPGTFSGAGIIQLGTRYPNLQWCWGSNCQQRWIRDDSAEGLSDGCSCWDNCVNGDQHCCSCSFDCDKH